MVSALLISLHCLYVRQRASSLGAHDLKVSFCSALRPKQQTNMCDLGHPTDPNVFPPILKLFIEESMFCFSCKF